MECAGETKTDVYFHLGDSHLVNAELIQGCKHLKPIKILGQQEHPCFTQPGLLEQDELPELARDLIAPVALVISPNKNAGKSNTHH